MIKIQGKTSQTSISILIDPRPRLSYISLEMVEKCKLLREKHNKSWLVQLETRKKRK